MRERQNIGRVGKSTARVSLRLIGEGLFHEVRV
jgi:hypothetical protein